jgi:hypothetical protein
MDLHKNFRDGKNEEAVSSKRSRNNSATTEGEKEASSSSNPFKRWREENKERERPEDTGIPGTGRRRDPRSSMKEDTDIR